MFEAFKGLNILDPKFYIPVIIGIVVLLIIVKVAKKLVKFAVFIAVVALALLIYFNMPSVKLNGTDATIKIKGQEYVVNAKDVKIKSEDTDGKRKIYLVSGETRIELPFSKDFAERFILGKLKGESK
jgi:hypothetical protein